MKVQFIFYYDEGYDLWGSDGREDYGNYLYYPSHVLKEKLEGLGHECVVSKEGVESVDCVVLTDWGPDFLDVLDSLPTDVSKILVCAESKLYVPWLHHAQVMFLADWSAVLTYNRGFSGPRIVHYDIPISPDLQKRPLKAKKLYKGVVVASLKNDNHGDTRERDQLYYQLATKGEIDLYGHGWAQNEQSGVFGVTRDKIYTMSGYQFALVVENNICPGYVTEKLGDSVLAGLPAIYWGDSKNAERRFGKVFVPLSELTEKGFLEAKEKLFENYDALVANVLVSRSNSNTWCDSCIDAITGALDRLGEIIKADDMFDPIDDVDNTDLFKRSENPMFPPEEDGWWLQGFNREHYNRTFGGFQLTKLELSKIYQFKVGGSGLPLLKSGFSLPESQLVWTNGSEAVMAFEMPQANNNLELSVTAYPFAPATLGDDQLCEVYLNDSRIATWTLISLPIWRRQFRKLWPNNKPFTAIIRENIFRPGEIVKLSFNFNKLTSPKQVGHSGDSRLLGLAFERLSIGPARSVLKMKSMGRLLKNMLRR